MAVSGQVSEQQFPIYKVTEMALRRCGIPTGAQTAEMAMVCRDHLYLMQSAWATLGVNLWCQEKLVLPLYENVPTITLPVGTIDLLLKSVTYRTLTRPTGSYTSSAGGTAAFAFDGDIDTICTQTSPLGNISVDYGSDNVVTSVGYLPGATSTLSLVFEYSADGITWSTSYAPGSTDYVDGEWVWYDIAYPVSAEFYRCRAASGTLVVRELYFGTSPSEIVIPRVNRDDYVGLPDKTSTGDVTQFWLDRQRVQPVMYLWKVPNTTFKQIVAWRQRYIMDPGIAQNDADVPQRWLDAVVKGVAARMLLEIADIAAILNIPLGVDVKTRWPMLKQEAQEALNLVSNFEYDQSPINLTPNISGYTQ
jgi:hypothetical protein